MPVHALMRRHRVDEYRLMGFSVDPLKRQTRFPNHRKKMCVWQAAVRFCPA